MKNHFGSFVDGFDRGWGWVQARDDQLGSCGVSPVRDGDGLRQGAEWVC